MKNNYKHRWALSVAIFSLIAAAAHPRGPVGEPSRDVRGRVTLTVENPRMTVRDASRVVVWLAPLDTDTRLRTISEPHRYLMAQHNKSFQPGMLVVPVGAAVDFPNLDPWFHNVFSLYQGKRFDLGLYEAGSRKQVIFDRPGASYIFCNIHPQMHAVVLAVDSNYFGISDKAGRVSIPDVPSGAYKMHVWYEDAAPKTLEALDRGIIIDSGDRTLPVISVAAVPRDPLKHKNKYGEDYDPTEQTSKY